MYDLYDALKELDELYSLTEARTKLFQKEIGKPINLTQVRVINTTKMDIRNEYETNTCIDYYPKNSDEPILTRIQTRVVVLKKDLEGVKFLGQRGRSRIYLPGGGFDKDKDGLNPANTVIRELAEESDLKVSKPIEIASPA